ncbi:MAG: four helix bundle protein [Cyclobacteriaceae bacterium]
MNNGGKKLKNPVQDKSFAFAVRIVRLYQHLTQEKKEFVLSRQLLRSGTGIGANVEEGVGGFTRKDFRAKLSIAYKEARETKYWLRLLKETGYINEEAFESMLHDCE